MPQTADASTGSSATTEGVRVDVAPWYLAEHSDPPARQWVFGYKATITNLREEPVRLVSRRWEIVDADGDGEVVDGDGVVGLQPTIEPGRAFSYSSYCPLRTHWGTMEGVYRMERPGGDGFVAQIARFILVGPRAE